MTMSADQKDSGVEVDHSWPGRTWIILQQLPFEFFFLPYCATIPAQCPLQNDEILLNKHYSIFAVFKNAANAVEVAHHILFNHFSF